MKSKLGQLLLAICQMKNKVMDIDYKANMLSTSDQPCQYQVFSKPVLWYYRSIGVTFGGLTADSNNQIVSNKWLRYWSNMCTISIVVIGLVMIYFRMYGQNLMTIYDMGLQTTYYLLALINTLDILVILVNQIFMNYYAIPILEIIRQHGIGMNSHHVNHVAGLVGHKIF